MEEREEPRERHVVHALGAAAGDEERVLYERVVRRLEDERPERVLAPEVGDRDDERRRRGGGEEEERAPALPGPAGAAARRAAERERQEAAGRPEGARVLLGEHGRAREETRDDRAAGARRALGAEDEEGARHQEEPERRVVHHLPVRHAPELEGDEPEHHERRRHTAGEPPGEEIEDGRHGREHGEHREPGHLEACAEEPKERGREVEGARSGDVGHVAVHDLAGRQADAGGEDVPLVAAADGAEDERGMQHGGAEGEATGDRPIGGARAGIHGSEALAAGPGGRNDCAGTGRAVC